MSTEPQQVEAIPKHGAPDERGHRFSMWNLLGIGFLLAILAAGYGWSSIDVSMEGMFSHVEQIALTILVVAAVAWFGEILPLFATGLFVLFLALVWLQPELNKVTPTAPVVFMAPFFSDVIVLYLGGFVISRGMEQEQLNLRLVSSLLGTSGNSPTKLLLTVMGITAFISMWLSNTSTTVMMLSVMMPVINHLPANSSSRRMFLLGIPFAANIGGLGTPVGTPPNAIVLASLRKIDLAPDFLTWMKFGVPAVVILIFVAWGILLLTSLGKQRSLNELDLDKPKPFTASTWVVLATILLTVLGWLTSDWHGMKSGTIALIPCLVFFGTGILKPLVIRTLAWDVLLLMGGGLCLGEVIERTGLAKTMVGALPLEGLSAYWLMIVLSTIACTFSTLMSNTAAAALIMPLVITMAGSVVAPVSFGVAFGCSLAMALPISTPPNALAFSVGGLKSRDMVVPGTLIGITGLVVMATLGWKWWEWLGLI